MSRIDYLKQSLDETGVQTEALDAAERFILVAKLLTNFDINVDHTFPWDTSSAPETSQIRDDGWEQIARYVGANPSVVFMRYAETVYRVRNGSDLHTLIGEAYGDEYFVCDEEVTYLLCHNHHDYLMGWGAAREFVGALPSLCYVNCRVCGYQAPLTPAWQDGGRLDGTCCACCGVLHGHGDSTLPDVLRYRAMWLANGVPWHDPMARPKSWNPDEPLGWIPLEFRGDN